MDVFLTLIETAGTQPFIFATNRLRQNVGASELVFRLGTQVTLEAVSRNGGPACWSERTEERARALTEERTNRRIETGGKVEVVVATSGRAILLTDSEERARQIVHDVTAWAAREAPGLSVCGVIKAFDFDSQSVHEIVRQASREVEQVRGALPSPLSRFLRLPIIDDCRTSGLPASEWARPTEAEDEEPQSAVALAKYAKAELGYSRIQTQLSAGGWFPRSIEELERRTEEVAWLGVLHADGNGIGSLFQNLDKYLQTGGDSSKNRAYVDGLRCFSLGLELCTESALRSALENIAPASADDAPTMIPVIPLVLGGDDFTALCDGRLVLRLARRYLQAIEEETTKHVEIVGDVVSRVAERAYGVPRLTACAGVAIVKPHFPFHAAYELAESLLAEAKTVKKMVVDRKHKFVPCSAFDFHILEAASGAALGRIREGRSTRVGAQREGPAVAGLYEYRLWGGPYILTPADQLAAVANKDSVRLHHFERLEALVAVVKDKDANQRLKLPRTMLHELRAGLLESKPVADSRLQMMLPRYRDRGVESLIESEEGKPLSLFREEQRNGTTVFVTSFLDALDASELW